MARHTTRTLVLISIVVALVITATVGGIAFWYYHRLAAQFADTQAQLASTTTAYESELATSEALSQNLSAAEAENDQFSNKISNISNTVGALTKLSQTDPQLLEKYSKVYFLNENYIPAALTDIATSSTYGTDRTLQFDTPAYPFLSDLLAAAKNDGIDLLVTSAYRSFAEQSKLKSAYTVTYGTGANTFSADQGYSEHQLGTTVDFTTASLKGQLSGFDKTPAYTWLTQNAYKYGFELSYPKNNGYYIYEPWHWRFVGKSLAETLHETNGNFYNLDQRTINSYLIGIFNP